MKAIKYCSNVQWPYAAGHPNRIDKLKVLKIAKKKHGKNECGRIVVLILFGYRRRYCYCYDYSYLWLLWHFRLPFALTNSDTSHWLEYIYHMNYYWFAIRSHSATHNKSISSLIEISLAERNRIGVECRTGRWSGFFYWFMACLEVDNWR